MLSGAKRKKSEFLVAITLECLKQTWIELKFSPFQPENWECWSCTSSLGTDSSPFSLQLDSIGATWVRVKFSFKAIVASCVARLHLKKIVVWYLQETARYDVMLVPGVFFLKESENAFILLSNCAIFVLRECARDFATWGNIKTTNGFIILCCIGSLERQQAVATCAKFTNLEGRN